MNIAEKDLIALDQDHTVVLYNVQRMEELAHQYLKQSLINRYGWPIKHLKFDGKLVLQGLIVDGTLGNLLKLNQSGSVWKAFHGKNPMSGRATREAYPSPLDLEDPRFRFLNSLYSISKGSMFAQLVDELDLKNLGPDVTYEDLARLTKQHADRSHQEGRMKREILSRPEEFLLLDPDVVPMLEELRRAKKKIVLVTNSQPEYTEKVMKLTLEPFLPPATPWKTLFDAVIVGAQKPSFFWRADNHERKGPFEPGETIVGSSAAEVERRFNVSTDKILYIGDHPWDDIHASKQRRWQTLLIFREIEREQAALEVFKPDLQMLEKLLAEKQEARRQLASLLTTRDLYRENGTPTSDLDDRIAFSRKQIKELKKQIKPLLTRANQLGNPNWGLATKTGVEISLLGSLIQTLAGGYTSTLSNLRWVTPYGRLSPKWMKLPHEPN